MGFLTWAKSLLVLLISIYLPTLSIWSTVLREELDPRERKGDWYYGGKDKDRVGC